MISGVKWNEAKSLYNILTDVPQNGPNTELSCLQSKLLCAWYGRDTELDSEYGKPAPAWNLTIIRARRNSFTLEK